MGLGMWGECQNGREKPINWRMYYNEINNDGFNNNELSVEYKFIIFMNFHV
jgi:hypothetical protein